MKTPLYCEIVDEAGVPVSAGAWPTFEVGEESFLMVTRFYAKVLRDFKGAARLAMHRHPAEPPFFMLDTTYRADVTAEDYVAMEGARGDLNVANASLRMDVLLGLTPVRTFEQWRAAADAPTLETAYRAGFLAGAMTTRTLQEADT